MKIFNLRRVMQTALLLLLMSAGATKVFAQDSFVVDDITYQSFDGTTAVVWGCNIGVTSLNIPSSVTYNNNIYKVDRVSDNAFYNNSTLTDVILPNSVTIIGSNAFKDCTKITTVVLPEELTTLSSGAFSGCSSLQYFNKRVGDAYISPNELPSTLETIYVNTFYGCSSLQSIRIPSSITEIRGGAFQNCTILENVYVFCDTAPTLGDLVFSGTPDDLKIYVPANSKTNYENAINWSSYAIDAMPAYEFLTYTLDTDNHTATVSGYLPGIAGELVIPNKVYVYNNQSVPFDVVAIDDNDIDHGAFNNCTSLTKVTFPSTMQSIENYAFVSCYNLAEVDFSACTSLTNLGASAFAFTALTSVSLPSTLTEIKNAVFNGCSSLVSVDIPNGVKKIGVNAFRSTSLASLTLPASVGSIGQKAFELCNNLSIINAYRTTPPVLDLGAFPNPEQPIITVYVPNGSAAAYQNNHESGSIQGWGDHINFTFVELPANTLLYSYDDVNHTATLTGYVGEVSGVLDIPSIVTKNNVDYTVTAISDNAFMGCSNLRGVTFPATLTSIGQYAFRECTGITSVVIPSTLTDLGDGAFLWCTSLAEVTLPDNLTRIGKGMFEGAAFTEIELPNSLQVIDKLAFYATGLTSVTLPESVTAIGEMAFRDCLDLEYVVALPTTPPTINANSFEDVENIPLYTSETSYDAYNDDPLWSTIFNTSCRPGLIYNTQTTTATVSGCTLNYVGDLVIPSTFGNKTVVGIETNALKDQQYITSMSIPASVTSIGDGNFKNCPSLASFTVDASNTEYKAVNDVLFNKACTLLLAYPAGKTATSYDMPYGVVSVSEDAFYKNNSLTAINLSAALNMENPYLFLRDIDNLTTITVDGGSTHYQTENGVLFNYGKTKLLYFPDGKDGNYTIPASASTIGAWSFYNCKNLNSVTINSTVSDIEANAFWGCKGLTAVIIPGNITTVKENTFNNSGLKSVTFLGNVTAIENGAFAGTALTSVTLPASVTNIGTAFAGCESLGEITCKAATVPTTALGAFWNVPTDIPVYVPAASVSAYQNATGWSQFTNIQAITDPNQYITYTYDDNNYTATVTGLSQQYSGALVIPGTVTHNDATYTVTAIADNAFKDNTGLTSVDIAHTVETIGASAFSGCTGMTDLIIGRNVKTIGKYAFSSCTSLTNIVYYAVGCENVATPIWSATTAPNKTLTIKNSVRSIPDFAFSDLGNLASVTIPDNTESIGTYAFSNCHELTTVTFGYKLKTIGPGAFKNSGITSIDMNNVENAYDGAFSNCRNLSTVTLRNSMTQIWSNLFEGCTALESVDIPSAVTYIGPHAFSGCTSLATLSTAGYASNLTTIDKGAFRDCTALTSIDIPNSVTSINDLAFYGADDLKNITIGTGLQSMGSAVFCLCSALENITYNATHCYTFGSMVWSGTGDNDKTLTIGANVEVIPSRAFESLLGFTTVTLPNALTLIRSNAFEGCSLTEITIPNNVTEIEYDAFLSCNLQTIVLGSKLNNIGSYAFAGNAHIAEITSYNTTPPAVTGNTFSNYDATLKVLAPAINAYNAHSVWSRFTNKESLDGYYFTGTTDSNWGTASNWSNGTVPTTEYEEVTAVIMADATVNVTDAFVKSFTIMDGTTVTIASGKSLKIGDGGNGSFTSSGASALVVKDGGSLVNNLNQNIAATVEKIIAGHNGNAGKWYFVSSPIVGANTYEENYNLYYYTSPNNVENLFANPANNYDLYAFDQSAAEAEWVNYKQHSEDFKLVDGNGYLYANHDNVTLSFAGDVRPSNSDYSMTPVFKQDVQTVYNNPDNPDEGYNEQTVDYPFTGWNLVGNPFTCKAYIKDDYSVLSSGFYKMNPDGTGITSVEGFSEEIPAGTGVFVKVSDMYDPMSGNQYAFTTETPMRGFTNGSLQVVLKQALMRGDAVQVDNAIVSFNEGNPLEKLVLFRDDAHIAIPQNGKKYAIVCTEPCGEMPLNLDAVMGGRFTLEVAPKDVEMSYLHLIDNLTGTDVDLLKESSYSFESNISDYASRFKLVFVAGSAAAEMEDFAFFSNGNLVIANNGEAMLQVVDINGRVLRSERINGSTNVSLKESAGVYVLRLVNGENVKNQKIIIK